MTPEGAVVAMVGGVNYQESQFNRAITTMRQPGSTFKLFVYYAALKQGLTMRDRVRDGPIESTSGSRRMLEADITAGFPWQKPLHGH